VRRPCRWARVADAHGQPAFEQIQMLFLEHVVVRRRALPARLQFLERDADAIAVAEQRRAQVPVAHAEARAFDRGFPGHADRGDRTDGGSEFFRHGGCLRDGRGQGRSVVQFAEKTPQPQVAASAANRNVAVSAMRRSRDETTARTRRVVCGAARRSSTCGTLTVRFAALTACCGAVSCVGTGVQRGRSADRRACRLTLR